MLGRADYRIRGTRKDGIGFHKRTTTTTTRKRRNAFDPFFPFRALFKSMKKGSEEGTMRGGRGEGEQCFYPSEAHRQQNKKLQIRILFLMPLSLFLSSSTGCRPKGVETWVGLTLISVFHHLSQLPSCFCQIPIRPSRVGQTMEHSKSKSTKPSLSSLGTPCTKRNTLF